MEANDNINTLHNIYLQIVKLHEGNPPDVWNQIATLMHTNSDTFARIYRKVRHHPELSKINILYNDKLSNLEAQIKTEADPLVKLSLMIAVLHQIIYQLLSMEGNYKLKLDGQEEMIILKKKIIYYVSVSEKPERNIYFHAYILLISLESLFNSHLYLGLDFEYTGTDTSFKSADPLKKRKKIKLAQLNFEHNSDLRSIIMIVSPDALDLDPPIMKNFIRLIMCNGHIKKILHGPDALDIPYVYDQMLNSDPTKIIKFTRAFIDTKVLCEYYKLNLEPPSDSICKMYDVLLYFKVISDEKMEQLNQMQEELPHPNEIVWDIHKLPESQLLYAQYDVIYLKYFYYQMMTLAADQVSDPLAKKSIMTLYKHVLFELTQFSYLERKEITFVQAKCKEEIDPINNYMIRYFKPNAPPKILKLIDIYNQISPNIVTTDPTVKIDGILKVNYFKAPVATIIKKMTYTLASKIFTIYKDKNTVWPTKLDNSYIFEFFETKMDYKYLARMFKGVESILESKLKMLFGI
jgi:hypothetical protein